MTGSLRGPDDPVLVLATANLGKVAEFRRLLRGTPWTLLPLGDSGFVGDLEEAGETYADNALAKAAAVTAQLGLAALADDSGIEVDALRGWPGPRSARWMGTDATDKDRLHGLIAEVDRLCPDQRQVRYVCAAALCRPAAEPVVAHGECRGMLVAPRGAGGFGYDPAFRSADLGVTFGEAADRDKDLVSHRGRALRRLAEAAVLDPPQRVR